MAVKQAQKGNLEAESKYLHLMTEYGAKHIVKLYKSVHDEGGTGTSDKFDPRPFDRNYDYDADLEVSRIYLEYCVNGDLKGTLERPSLDPWNAGREFQVPEELVWRIFKCLGKAV
jgi:hypothetical protein